MGVMASQITSLPIVHKLNRLFRRRTKKTSRLRVTGLCAGNSPVTGEFPTQMASNAENASIWWRHHLWCFPSAKKLLGMYPPSHGLSPNGHFIIYFTCNSNLIIIPLLYPNKICTCHDGTHVVACAKICNERLVRIRIGDRWVFHRIWITREKSSVKWALDEMNGFT